MAVNKVIYGGNTLVDLTGDTVTAADLADGVKATGADGKPIVGLLQKVTIDSSLSATSTNPVQNKVIKAELDKKMAKTDKIYEANLVWGGKNFTGGYGCIDAAMIPDLGANRLAFGRAKGITVEYSTDAGETWLDYGYSDIQKIGIFATGQVTTLGKSTSTTITNDCMLRITIDTKAFGVYTSLNKFAFLASANTTVGAYCTIDASLKATPNVFVTFADKIAFWGGPNWNIINTRDLTTYNNTPSFQYGLIRFTFGCTSVTPEDGGISVQQILGFGGVGWEIPSNMAKHGHLYDYNNLQEAIFPANVTAPTFIGNLTGTATEATKAQRLALQAGTTNVNRPVIFQDSANYAGELLANRCSTFQYNPATDNLTVGKINGFTIETSVPANAKFTDTVYTHPSTHPASMITGLSTVATSGSYNDLTDKPNIPASSTVDSELSSTSTNPVQNKVIYNALLNKVGTDIYSGFSLMGATSTIAWRQGSQPMGSINATNYTGTAAKATQDGAGNVITETYATKADVSGVVKSVNGTKPDTDGNVSITVSGGDGVSLSAENTWTGKQTFRKMKFGFESYNTPRISGGTDNPSESVAVYNVQGNFTLDMSVLAGLLNNGDATLFTAYITANGAYTLSITNAGTLKYVGNASDLAITVNGLLLNILLIKNSSGDLSSVVQASALS